MRILVTGARGQLGTDVLAECAKRGIDTIGLGSADMDITDAEAVERVMKSAMNETPYDAVIHCAAYTAVDKAEDEPERAHLVNASGTRSVALMCKALDIPMMYISTDYVFDGEGTKPWQPDDTDRHPLNAYGRAKYEGELAVEELLEKFFIVRISWVFGEHGGNFVKTMLRLGRERGAVSVVDDQIGSPTYTPDLSKLLIDMIQTDKYGRYHACNEGFTSWYEYACEIFRQAGMTDVKVTPVASDAFPTKARRPHNSRMDTDKLTAAGFDKLPAWQDALRRFLQMAD